MIEIAYLKEKNKIKAMPKEVQEIIEGILQILDEQSSFTSFIIDSFNSFV